MLKDKKFMLLIAFFLTQNSIAGHDHKIDNDDIPNRIIVPIHLLVDDDAPLPASEQNVDYSIYKVGVWWPDWDWSEEGDAHTIRSPSTQKLPTIKSPSSAPQKSPPCGCFAQLLAYFKYSS